MSPYCSQRFKQLSVQIYIYLHVINIEAEPELVWATIPGQFPGFAFIPSDGHLDCACVSGFFFFFSVFLDLRWVGDF